MAITIMHATDFSREAEAGEAAAAGLARGLGAELILVHVAVETPLYGESVFGIDEVRKVYVAQARWAEDALAERARALGAAGVSTRWLRRVGVPHEEIVKAAAEERVAYLVLGTHGRGGLGRFMLGSAADRVVRTAPCPVLTVRPSPAR